MMAWQLLYFVWYTQFFFDDCYGDFAYDGRRGSDQCPSLWTGLGSLEVRKQGSVTLSYLQNFRPTILGCSAESRRAATPHCTTAASEAPIRDAAKPVTGAQLPFAYPHAPPIRFVVRAQAKAEAQGRDHGGGGCGERGVR